MKKIQCRIAIVGANGKMGRELVRVAWQSENILSSVVLVRKGSSLVGSDVGIMVGIGELGIQIIDDLDKISDDFDVLIDFTSPIATLEYLNFCHQNKKNMVIGTTGFSKSDKETIKKIARDIGIVFSSNFSIGVNLMLKLLENTAKVMGNYTDIEIIEAHHRNKVDAPSSTALEIGKVITNSLDWDLSKHAVYTRKGYTGKRTNKTIGFSAIRAGDIVGEHTTIFADIGERIEITHKASSRMIFAKGAILAATWISNHKTGLYDMQDVLELKNLNKN